MAECKPSDRRLTPEWVLEAVRTVAGGAIAIDPCTEIGNPVGANIALCGPPRSVDGLTECWRSWAKWNPIDEGFPLAWVNPPFSRMAEWVDKATTEEIDSLILSSVDYTTTWWAKLDSRCAARCELARRVKCVDPATGRRMDVARSCAVWLRTDSIDLSTRFASVFCTLGRVIPLRSA